MDELINYFKENKYVLVEGLLEPQIALFAYNYFILKGCTNKSFSDHNENIMDDNWVRCCYGDLVAETILGHIEPRVSQLTQKKLCPTYSYSRLYITGDVLKPHTDRPACQYSVTMNLGGEPWPIYYGVYDEDSKDGVVVKGKKVKILNEIVMKPGDGAIYKGEDLVHWRDPFMGDHCVQTFLHYVDSEDEKYSSHKYDGRMNIGFDKFKNK
jgi:hypothetical protein